MVSVFLQPYVGSRLDHFYFYRDVSIRAGAARVPPAQSNHATSPFPVLSISHVEGDGCRILTCGWSDGLLLPTSSSTWRWSWCRRPPGVVGLVMDPQNHRVLKWTTEYWHVYDLTASCYRHPVPLCAEQTWATSCGGADGPTESQGGEMGGSICMYFSVFHTYNNIRIILRVP